MPAPPFAGDAEPQRVFGAGGDLACPDHPLRAAVETQEDCRVVIQPPSRLEGGEVGKNGLNSKPRNKCGEIYGMRSDIRDAAALASATTSDHVA